MSLAAMGCSVPVTGDLVSISATPCDFKSHDVIQGETVYALPPPLPLLLARKTLSGGGVYILKPSAAGILYAPLFYTPSTPSSRVFSGVSGVGMYEIWPAVPFGHYSRPTFSSRERMKSRKGLGPLLGHTPKGSYSLRGSSRHFLETSLLKTPSDNPSQNPCFENLPTRYKMGFGPLARNGKK